MYLPYIITKGENLIENVLKCYNLRLLLQAIPYRGTSTQWWVLRRYTYTQERKACAIYFYIEGYIRSGYDMESIEIESNSQLVPNVHVLYRIS